MLQGQVAVVTGGSRGIGAAVAKKLASLGVDLAVIYAGNQTAAENVCAEIRTEHGVRVQAYRCNVADYAAVKATVTQIKQDFGTITILVNNAGVTRDGLIAGMGEAEYDTVLDTNLKGAFNMIRHCSGTLIRNRGGRIINISSVSGLMGNVGQANYAASKAGLIGLTKSVAKELAPRGVTCNAIAPGFITTDMTESLEDSPLAAAIPMGRMGKPEEIAAAAAYLAEADYVTGTVLRVDGGIAM